MPTNAVIDARTGKIVYVELTPAQVAQRATDALAEQSGIDAKKSQASAEAKVRADGITHALSLGFTQAQSDAMFP